MVVAERRLWMPAADREQPVRHPDDDLSVLRRCSAQRWRRSSCSRLRNRVFFRLGVRNARRPGRTALIVAGLMLGTTIIAAALATGDTMSHTVRSAAVASLGLDRRGRVARGVRPRRADSVGATGVR